MTATNARTQRCRTVGRRAEARGAANAVSRRASRHVSMVTEPSDRRSGHEQPVKGPRGTKSELSCGHVLPRMWEDGPSARRDALPRLRPCVRETAHPARRHGDDGREPRGGILAPAARLHATLQCSPSPRGGIARGRDGVALAPNPSRSLRADARPRGSARSSSSPSEARRSSRRGPRDRRRCSRRTPVAVFGGRGDRHHERPPRRTADGSRRPRPRHPPWPLRRRALAHARAS